MNTSVNKPNPAGYWTLERVKEEALKYSNRRDFEKGSGGAYKAASRNSWLEEVCSHMKYLVLPSGYWTLERVKEEALKYSNRRDFEKSSSGAYSAASKNGWLEEVCSHMKYLVLPSGYWTLEKVRVKALKFSSREAFKKYERGAHHAAWKYGWMDEVCSHMKYGYDINVNYIWNSHENPDIWKIGASNKKKYMSRIRRVARLAKLTPYRIMTVAHDSARSLEQELLKIGSRIYENENVYTFDGSSEFRYMSEEQVKYCKQRMSEVGDLFGG